MLQDADGIFMWLLYVRNDDCGVNPPLWFFNRNCSVNTGFEMARFVYLGLREKSAVWLWWTLPDIYTVYPIY